MKSLAFRPSLQSRLILSILFALIMHSSCFVSINRQAFDSIYFAEHSSPLSSTTKSYDVESFKQGYSTCHSESCQVLNILIPGDIQPGTYFR